LASHYVPISVPNLQGALFDQKGVAKVLGSTAGFVGSLSAFGLNTFIAIFVMFFLLRDGKSLSRRLAIIMPLRPGQARRLFSLVKDTPHAIVYGTLAMAAIQGTLTGLASGFSDWLRLPFRVCLLLFWLCCQSSARRVYGFQRLGCC
jgi:predicted PurR-regulated permease PerM